MTNTTCQTCTSRIFQHIIHCQTHQTGAGYPSNEETDPSSNSGLTAEASKAEASEPPDSDHEEELCGQIAADIRANINNKPVKVPRSQSPLTTMAHKDIFFRALTDICAAGVGDLSYILIGSAGTELKAKNISKKIIKPPKNSFFACIY